MFRSYQNTNDRTDAAWFHYRMTHMQSYAWRGICCGPVSVRLSITTRCSIERTKWIQVVFGIQVASAYPTLCCKRIWLFPKRVFPLESCPKLWTETNCSAFSPWYVDRCKCCQVSSSVVSLSHWASTVVYNTSRDAEHRALRLRQLRLAERAAKCSDVII